MQSNLSLFCCTGIAILYDSPNLIKLVALFKRKGCLINRVTNFVTLALCNVSTILLKLSRYKTCISMSDIIIFSNRLFYYVCNGITFKRTAKRFVHWMRNVKNIEFVKWHWNAPNEPLVIPIKKFWTLFWKINKNHLKTQNLQRIIKFWSNFSKIFIEMCTKSSETS